jgi:hypothetical protein
MALEIVRYVIDVRLQDAEGSSRLDPYGNALGNAHTLVDAFHAVLVNSANGEPQIGDTDHGVVLRDVVYHPPQII